MSGDAVNDGIGMRIRRITIPFISAQRRFLSRRFARFFAALCLCGFCYLGISFWYSPESLRTRLSTPASAHPFEAIVRPEPMSAGVDEQQVGQPEGEIEQPQRVKDGNPTNVSNAIVG